MDTTQIQYFVIAAQMENVSRAADFLHVSQSALSKNISRLEEELGRPLFDRHGRKIVLNEAGVRFLECARAMLYSLENAAKDLRSTNQFPQSIRIGSVSTEDMLLRCMEKFQQLHPEAVFDLDLCIEGNGLPDINNYDVLIYPDCPLLKKYSSRLLYKESYYLAISNKNPLSEKAVLRPTDLENETLAFLRREDFFEFPATICAALGMRTRGHCYVDSQDAKMLLVAKNLAVGYIPVGNAGLFSDMPGVTLLPVMDNRFERPIMICFQRDKHISGLAREFKAFATEYFRLED